jgi:ubiquinone/menaquinone biosynthesis C-methylase UbiE
VNCRSRGHRLRSSNCVESPAFEQLRRVKVDDPVMQEFTRWERIGHSTRWGRYLAQIEKELILRGEEYAAEVGKAIDVGCGGGRWSKHLSDRGWDITCLDVSSEDLTVCQRRIPSAQCILARPDDNAIPVESDWAKIMLCIEVVPIIEAKWFAKEASRILQRGGILIGVCINGQSMRGMASRLTHRLMNGRTKYNFYQSTYAECRQNLLLAGFEVLQEESCCWGPFGRESNSLLVPAFVKLERALRLNRVIKWGPWVTFIARNTSA